MKIKTMNRAFGVALPLCIAMAFALILGGCSSGGQQQPSNTATEEAATEEAATEEAATEEQKQGESISEEKTKDDADSVDEEEPEEEPAKQPVEAHLNTPISTEEYDLEFVDAYWDAANSEGDWVYYQDDTFTKCMSLAPDTPVFVVRVSITNKASSAIRPSFYYRGKALVNGKYEYDVKATSESGTSDITPLETSDVLLYVEIPQAMKDQFEDIDVQWGFTVDDTYPQSLDDVHEVYDLYFK